MSDVQAMRAALEKEIRKLDRQQRTVEATRAMINLLTEQIQTLEKKSK